MAYSQRDPKWANSALGSGFTIGNSGCAITAACNVAAQYGHAITPPQMVSALQAKGKNAADFQGSYLSLLFPDITYRGFVAYNTKVDYNQLAVQKQAGVEGILKMDSNPNVAGIQLHFSRLRGVDVNGKVVIDDSWTGQRALVESVYGNQEKAIWGCDFYYKAPATPPVVVPPTAPPVPVDPHVTEIAALKAQLITYDQNIALLKQQKSDVEAQLAAAKADSDLLDQSGSWIVKLLKRLGLK